MADPATYTKGSWTDLLPAATKAKLENIENGIKANNDALVAETDAGRAITQAADADAQRTLLNVEDGADVTDEANVTAIAVATDEVTAAPAHWWVLVAGALKRMTHAGWTALVLAATGKTNAATGFTLAGGTTSKTLTVSADADTANIPAAAPTATPTASRVPVADGSGKLDGWITGGAPTATQTASRIPLYNAAKGINADGISFPATQAPSADANTLDDYEEGTWTPTFIGATGDSTGTSIVVEGNYTKIGREVFASAIYKFTSIGGWTSYARFGGMPFTPLSVNHFNAKIYCVYVDVPDGIIGFSVGLYTSRAFYYIQTMADNANITNLQTNAFNTSNCVVRLDLHYIV